MTRSGFRSRLSPRDLRALQLGALLVVPALAWAGVVRPLTSAHAAMRERIAAQHELLARERGVIAWAPQAHAAIARADAIAAGASEAMFEGADAIAATSALASYARALAEEHEVNLRQTTSAEPLAGEGGFARVAVEVEGEAPVAGILGFLDALESGEYAVTVSRVSMERLPSASGDIVVVLKATLSGIAAPAVTDHPDTTGSAEGRR